MKTRRVIFIAVLVLMALTIFPQIGLTQAASAAESNKAINVGPSVLQANANTSNAPIVVIGNAEHLVANYVEGQYLSLFARFNTMGRDVIFGGEISDYYGNTGSYSDSYLRSYVEKYYNNNFSAGEKNVLKARNLTGGCGPFGSNTYDPDKIMGNSVNNVKYWAPTVKEAQQMDRSLRMYPGGENVERYAVGAEWYWCWLSTPGDATNEAAVLDNIGQIDQEGFPTLVMFFSASARGLCHLDMNSVILTSDSEGKQSGSLGPDALRATDNYSSRYWKVTVKDDSRNDFKVSQCPYSYDLNTKEITVHYSGAVTGGDNYISAVITDSTGKNVKYYGRVAKATESSGNVTINTAGKAGNGDRLFIFNEKISDKMHSDLSSELKEIKIERNMEFSHPWNYSIEWNSAGTLVNGVKGKCPICGTSRAVEYQNAYSTGVSEISPTCEEDGERIIDGHATIKQDDGSYVTITDRKTTKLPAKGHSWSSAVFFNWDSDVCVSAYRYCVYCNKQQYKTRDNNEVTTYEKTDKKVAPTCTEDGYKVCYAEVEFDGSVRRSSDHKVTLPAAGHNPGDTEEEVVKAPTCTETGESNVFVKCTKCGEVLAKKTITTRALGHDWTEWITDPNDSTRQTRSCQREGCTATEERANPDHSKHTIELVPAKDPTCMEDGNNECYQCTECLEYFEDKAGTIRLSEEEVEEKVIIPAIHHWNLLEWVDETLVEPTCTASGYHNHIYKCSKCGEQMTWYMVRDDALGHDWADPTYEWNSDNTMVTATRACQREGCGMEVTETVGVTSEVTKNPTCTEKGETTYTSGTFANEAFKVQTKTEKDIDPLGHDWDEPSYVWNSDNTRVTATRVCKREGCGEKQTETADVTSQVTKEPTCTEEGETTYTSKAFTNKEFTVQTKTEPIEALGHDWGDWEIARDENGESRGFEVRICKRCEKYQTRYDPYDQKGIDGTDVGPGASYECADKAITEMESDEDIEGSRIAPLRIKSLKQKKKAITVKWTKADKAVKYIIYGNRSGKSNRMEQLAESTEASKKFTKVAGKKLKKGTHYKFILLALDKYNDVVSTSKVIHVVTKGGKYCNAGKVAVKKAVISRSENLKVGETLKLKAKAVKARKALKMKKIVAMRYESSNSLIANVSGKGVVKALEAGTCYIYAYGQNGAIKEIKVTVQ